MPHTKITQAFVEGLPFHDSTDWYHDTELAGFNLSVGRRSKTYYAAAENDGRFMRVKIGRADVTKANEARAVARDILLPEIRRGVDPRSKYFDDTGDTAYARIMRGIRMSDEKADLALRGRRKKDADKVTVGHVWGMYEEYHLARLIEDQGPEKANRAKKHIAEQRRLLGGAEKYLKDGPPAATEDWPNGWWERPIQSITPELCYQTWRNLSRTRGRRTAQLFFTSVKVLFNYAVAKEEVQVSEHPLIIDMAGNGRGLPKGWQALRPTNPVQRISDIRIWWRDVDKLSVIPKSALKVMLLTGMRPSEALAMRWDQVDLEVGKVWFGMTALQKHLVVALLEAGMDVNGAETVDGMRADNMCVADVSDLAKRTGLNMKQVKGVLASSQAWINANVERANGEKGVDQWLNDWGVQVAFELLAMGVEAMRSVDDKIRDAKIVKMPAPKAAPKPRVLADRVMIEPGKPEDVKATKAGSKRHLMAKALAKGVTIEELMETLCWNKDTVSSALRTDMGALGLGVERKAGKYYLLFPKGVKSIPAHDADTNRAAALVAACK